MRPALIERVRAMSLVDAPSGGGADALKPAATAFAAELAMLGGSLRRSATPQGELLELSLGPSDGRPVLILGHYDTVWPAGTSALRPPTLDGDTLSGPGVFDMRGGIAAAITALSLLGAGRLAAPTVLMLTPDEETGSMCSRDRIIELARAARCVLVLEPPLPGGALKTSRSGWAVYSIEVGGVSSHAGLEPSRGVSAIDELCDLLVDLRTLAASDLGTTLNAGVIAGGTLPNLRRRARRHNSTCGRGAPWRNVASTTLSRR